MFVRYKGKKTNLNVTFTKRPYRFAGPGSIVEVTLAKDFQLLTGERCAGSFEEVLNAQGDPMPPETDEAIESLAAPSADADLGADAERGERGSAAADAPPGKKPGKVRAA